MLEFFCDTCHKRKKDSQNWILGLAAESKGTHTDRREITILTEWSYAQAVHPLAVHFCCERCREKYTNWLFNYEIAS
ncbi:MAG TPA: hypothetical protein VHQ22_07585 [Terriglobales bacterium]|jgi:hypothetical protein|nr:hypothetical protein [Terriglobales bacterium]